jgi:hypothetical protein
LKLQATTGANGSANLQQRVKPSFGWPAPVNGAVRAPDRDQMSTATASARQAKVPTAPSGSAARTPSRTS